MAYAEREARAARAMTPSVLSYVAGGAGSEHTQRANASAFHQWGLIPRMFVGAAQRDLTVDLFDLTLPSPLLMAPIGVIGLCAQDGHGDLATAEAAARTGVPMIASTLSADPLEDVAARFGGIPGFFQLYTPTDRDLAASLVSRAEAAGFCGIVVTLDTWLTGWRPRDLAASNFPPPRGHCLANYFTDPVFARLLGRNPADDPAAASGASAPPAARAGPKPAGWPGSTARPAAAAKPTAGCRPWTACPAWWPRPTGCPCSSTQASGPGPT